MAVELAASIRKGGGLITTTDLAAYQVKDRAPLTGSYRGCEIVTAPPPSAGGIVLLEILDPPATTSPRWATALRSSPGSPTTDPGRWGGSRSTSLPKPSAEPSWTGADYLGDPDFGALPIAQLASPGYAAAWRKSILPIKPSPSATLTRPVGLPASAACFAARRGARIQRDHALLRGRCRRQRRLRSPPRSTTPSAPRVTAGRPGLSAQRRDGRLRRQAGRAQSVRPHPGAGQRHRPRQAPALAP